uniref:CSON000458 protein n=1 Tax=Culicoides sonorensis TaxID=179676 RepID=A0A336KF63_CULSO
MCGTFRLSCEHVLESLKKGRETLLTLLEAFVYDPLVDWAIGEDVAGGLAVTTTYGDSLNCDLLQASKQLEREVTRDTLAIRFAEIKTDWLQNRDEIKYQLTKLQTYFYKLNAQRGKLQEVEGQFSQIEKQLKFIEDVQLSTEETLSGHPLNTISQRYSLFKKYKEDFEMLNRMLMEKSKEYQILLSDYKEYSSEKNLKQLNDYLKEIDEILLLTYENEFEIVQDFLVSSNQNNCYTNGIQARTELTNSINQQTIIVQQCLQVLIQYNSVSRFLPPEYLNFYCTSKHFDWLNYVTVQKSCEACRDVKLQYQLITTSQDSNVQPSIVFNFAYQQQSIINDFRTIFQMNVDCLNNELIEYQTQDISSFYKEAKVAISRYIAKDFAAKKALECVALTALCDVNKRFLMLEMAANNAGENLINFMTDEKWFLDELYLYSSLIVELLGLVSNDGGKNGHFQHWIKVMKGVNHIYGVLREMFKEFCVEMLPKTMQSVISGDESVLNMIQSVSVIYTNVSCFQNEICKYLMRNSTDSSLKNYTNDLKEAKETLVNLTSENDCGGVLLKQVNSVFDNVIKKHENILEIFEKTGKRSDLLTIDHFHDSLTLTKTIENHKQLLNDLFFIKKLECMLQFFTECLQTACGFKGTENGPVLNHDIHCRSIKHFISTFVWRAILGFGPLSTANVIVMVIEGTGFNLQFELSKKLKENHSLEELCKNTVTHSLKTEVFSVNTLNQASSLCINLDKTWKKRERIIQLQETIKMLQEELNTMQLFISAHYWLHEHTIVTQPNMFNLCPVSRAGLLLQFKNALENLPLCHQTIELQKNVLKSVSTDVLQRLKWALGANPNVEEIFNEFNMRSTNHRNKLDKVCLLAAFCTKYAQSIWKFEVQRFHTPDGLEKDKEFLQIISSYEQACIILNQYSTLLSPVEEAIVELLDPEGTIDHNWLNNVHALLQNILKQLISDISNEEKQVVLIQDKLQMHAHTLRTLMGHHHKSSDIRALLKRAMKLNEAQHNRIREYFNRYKLFIDTISELYTNVLSKDFTEKMVETSLMQISELNIVIMAIYDDLFMFNIEDFNDENTIREFSPSHMVFDVQQKAQTQKEQKRNAYAVSVWRRIRMKLEGRDRDPNKRQTLQEQVDWMIREAISPDNLAVLYEGWTPWV